MPLKVTIVDLVTLKGQKLQPHGAKVTAEPKSYGHKSSFHACLGPIIPRGSGLWLHFQMVSSGINTTRLLCPTASAALAETHQQVGVALGITEWVAPVARFWPPKPHPSPICPHAIFSLLLCVCTCRSDSRFLAWSRPHQHSSPTAHIPRTSSWISWWSCVLFSRISNTYYSNTYYLVEFVLFTYSFIQQMPFDCQSFIHHLLNV